MMSVRQDEPALRKVCAPVLKSELTDLMPVVGRMKDICDGRGCVGLAANQVGLCKRIILVNCGGITRVIVNPEIVRAWGGLHEAEEGCWSFPGSLVSVVRPRKIRVRGVDEDWRPFRYAPRGVLARVILHEVDHLNGITMFMRGIDPELGYEVAA